MVTIGKQKRLLLSTLAIFIFLPPSFFSPDTSFAQTRGIQISLSSDPPGGTHLSLSDQHGAHPERGDVEPMAMGPSYNLPDMPIEDLASLEASGSPPPPRKGRYCEDDAVRAGCPHIVSPFAALSIDCEAYSLGRIGGGTLLGGEPACTTHDGTWAIDYTGRWIPQYVFLPWSHGMRYQGGYGAYDTEAPFNPHTRHSH